MLSLTIQSIDNGPQTAPFEGFSTHEAEGFRGGIDKNIRPLTAKGSNEIRGAISSDTTTDAQGDSQPLQPVSGLQEISIPWQFSP
jgi:hypothetical protein